MSESVSPEEIHKAKSSLQLNELCNTCENYKNGCDGLETVPGAIIMNCSNKMKYKKIKK